MRRRPRGGIRGRLAEILGDEEVVTIALGAAVAIALVGFATAVAATLTWRQWDWTNLVASGLQLLLVVAAVALLRPRTAR